MRHVRAPGSPSSSGALRGTIEAGRVFAQRAGDGRAKPYTTGRAIRYRDSDVSTLAALALCLDEAAHTRGAGRRAPRVVLEAHAEHAHELALAVQASLRGAAVVFHEADAVDVAAWADFAAGGSVPIDADAARDLSRRIRAGVRRGRVLERGGRILAAVVAVAVVAVWLTLFCSAGAR